MMEADWDDPGWDEKFYLKQKRQNEWCHPDVHSQNALLHPNNQHFYSKCWNIRLSVEESNSFYDLSKNRRYEGRNDGGSEIPEPSHEEVRGQSRGARSQDQALSKTWRNVTMSFGKMFRIIHRLSLRVYNCCLEEPNFFNQSRLVSSLSHFAKRNVRQNIRTFHSNFSTDPDETRILIDGDQPQETI
ncbi:uncharacterized protein [Dendrobates tinctorius]|uniref:uncharacterized protein isoform X2 n=1 Tax=Dendrobates tinctorius TaxID=92724 RepID=UPI003CC93893